jgi:hypothetical protein
VIVGNLGRPSKVPVISTYDDFSNNPKAYIDLQCGAGNYGSASSRSEKGEVYPKEQPPMASAEIGRLPLFFLPFGWMPSLFSAALRIASSISL